MDNPSGILSIKRSTRLYIKCGVWPCVSELSSWVKQPDRNDDAAFPSARERGRDQKLWRDELLTQSEILEKETSPLAKEASEHSKAELGEQEHGQNL